MKAKLPFQQYNNEHFLFLLPLFFVLHGYKEHFEVVFLKSAVLLLLNYLASAVLLAFLLFYFFNKLRKAALLTFLFFCFHFFFGILHDVSKQVFGDVLITRYSFILPFSTAVFLMLFFLLKNSNRSFNRMTAYFNIVLVILILLDTVSVVQKVWQRHTKQNAPQSFSFINCDTCAKPDVYLVVADEYAGYQTLKDALHFDNSGFENKLRQRGFHIVKDSKSNYNSSPYSIASMMSMNYLQNIDGDDDSKNDMELCFRKINDNTLIQFFRQAGYDFKSFSIFNFADIPTDAHSTIVPTKAKLISNHTFLGRLNKDLRYNLITKLHLKSELDRLVFADLKSNTRIFNQLLDETKNKGALRPRFTYTHLLMPHQPYYFNKEGQLNSFERLSNKNKMTQEEYIEYLQYCNERFLTLIDTILRESEKPPIILFMGDHGFRFYSKPVDLKYHYLNLCAVYLPNRQYSNFYEGMSNINIFRVLLNTQYGQELPLLKDSTIYIKL